MKRYGPVRLCQSGPGEPSGYWLSTDGGRTYEAIPPNESEVTFLLPPTPEETP